MLKSPSMLVCAAIFGGPLPFLLRTFLQNDSLMDIGQRADLYVVILRLVQSFGKPASCLLWSLTLREFAECTSFPACRGEEIGTTKFCCEAPGSSRALGRAEACL